MLHRLSEALADLGEMARDYTDAVVEFFAQRRDFLGFTGNGFLLPAIRDRLEQSDQRGWRGEDHFIEHAQLDQLWILLQSSAENCFVGNK